MMIAERWADVPAGCICKWAGTPGGWTRAGPDPRCQAVHDDGGRRSGGMMGKSRRYRQDGAERRKSFTTSAAPVLPSLWQRAQCCGATIAADASRMSKTWADVHEPGCPAPWEALGLGGPAREVYPGAPWAPAGVYLRAVNRRPGVMPSGGHQAALRRRA